MNTNKALTPKQACLAQESALDLNATAAAKRAGYSVRAGACSREETGTHRGLDQDRVGQRAPTPKQNPIVRRFLKPRIRQASH